MGNSVWSVPISIATVFGIELRKRGMLIVIMHHPLRGSYPIHAFVKSLYKAHFTWSDLSPGWTARTLFRLLVFTLHRDMLDALALQNLSFHPQWLPDLLCLLLSFMRTPPNSVQQNASFRLKYSDTVRKLGQGPTLWKVRVLFFPNCQGLQQWDLCQGEGSVTCFLIEALLMCNAVLVSGIQWSSPIIRM